MRRYDDYLIYERISIEVTDDVYEPSDDSYILAKAVEDIAFGKVLDLGTGSGIQGIVAALNGSDVTFADINQNALDVAKRNAKANNVNGNFLKSDLFSNIEEKFNTIIFNPPYLPTESVKLEQENIALDGGRDGREIIDRFLSSYKEHVMEDHKILLIESSLDDYQADLRKLNATIVGKTHMFFEDIVVLQFK